MAEQRASGRFSLDLIHAALAARPPQVIEGATHAAAVALVLRHGTRGLEALFIRRAEHPGDPWSGHIGLPGGRAEPVDAGLVHTAVRETSEEIGLPLDPHRHLIGPLDETRATARVASIDMKIAPFVFTAAHAPDTLTLSHEVASTHWIPLDVVFDPSRSSSVAIEREGDVRHFPAIAVEGLTIWGLTLRMLRNFEHLVTRARL